MVAASRWAARMAAVLLVVAASTAGAVLATPTSATAATLAAPPQMVEFSVDGIHWSKTYDKQLFSGVSLIPGSSASRSFYVRNKSTEAALLRITLAQVGTNDINYADALTISSSTAGAPGADVPLSLAQPCYTLSQGLRLSSGDSLRIDNTASLADLGGTAGQAGSAWFQLLVSFSSTDVGAPLPDACPVDFGAVDTFADPTEGGIITPASTASTAGKTVFHRTAKGWTPSTAVGGGTVNTPTTTTPVPPSTALEQTLVSNTSRLYQEYDIAFWLAMLVLGGVISLLVRRYRAGQPEDHEAFDQIGVQR